jgi:hypothetical protein
MFLAPLQLSKIRKQWLTPRCLLPLPLYEGTQTTCSLSAWYGLCPSFSYTSRWKHQLFHYLTIVSLPLAKGSKLAACHPISWRSLDFSAIHTIPKPINSPSMGVGPRCTEGGIYKLLSAVYSSLLNHSTSGFIHQNTSAEVTWSLSLRCVLQSTMARVDVPSLLLPDWITDSVY